MTDNPENTPDGDKVSDLSRPVKVPAELPVPPVDPEAEQSAVSHEQDGESWSVPPGLVDRRNNHNLTHDKLSQDSGVTADVPAAYSPGGGPNGQTQDDAAVEHEDEVRNIVTEKLAPSVTAKGVGAAVGVVAAAVLAAGFIGGMTGSSPVAVTSDDLTESPAVDGEVEDGSVVDVAADAVFRVDSEGQTGSSFLIEPGLLATNAHVAVGEVGETVGVTSASGEELEGEIVMVDEAKDISFVEIPEQDVDPLAVTSVANQQPGQRVTLAGYPIGLDMSISRGTAAAVDQVTSMRESPAQYALLQLDASVNPGSSGGPVLDDQGRVMGMVTFRPDTVGSRNVQGVSFAVPSNDLYIAHNQWLEHGDVQYGYLGVPMDTTTQGGAEVTHVDSGSPADQAGFESGDVIVGVGDYETDSYVTVSRHLHTHRPGDTVDILVDRDGEQESISVTLGDS